MESFGASHIGRVRPKNEDQYLIADLNKMLVARQTSLAHDRELGGMHGQLLLVADGMGGHAAGELASKIAIDTVTDYVLHTMDWFFRLGRHEEDLLDELQAALQRCHCEIQADAAENPEHHGMGTTLTMAYVIWPRLYVVHVGDSRCYLLRGGKLEQVTTDHTMAQRFVEDGRLSAEEAETSRWSHVLWNSLGSGRGSTPRPEVYKAKLDDGDTVMLCTDGLSKHVPLEQIREVLSSADGVENACQRLVDMANAAGGSDNVTVIVARFPEEADAEITIA
jgi:protein phosphatase